MKQIKEGAEIVEERMTFLQDFLQKKYSWGILFFVIMVLSFILGQWNGEKDSVSSIKSLEYSLKSLEFSLKNTRYSDSIEIKTLNNRISYFTKRLDSCNNNSLNSNLESLVTKKLEEAERIKRVLERKIVSDQRDVKQIENIIKN